MKKHNEPKLTLEQELCIHALFTSWPMAEVVSKVGASVEEIKTWMRLPHFCMVHTAVHAALLENDQTAYEKLLPKLTAELKAGDLVRFGGKGDGKLQ